MANLRPNEQRANYAILLIWIVMALDIISLISGYFQYKLIQNIAGGEFISEDTANANDTREKIIGIVYMAAYFISAITFIRWFRRAYYNLHTKFDYLSYTDGWAAGSWFVPFVNLYRPYQIMKQLYEETKELLLQKGLINTKTISTNFLIWWWILLLVNNSISHFASRYTLKAETIDEVIVGTNAGMIANAIGIPLALITIHIIKSYSNIEPLLNELNNDEINIG